MSESRSPKHQKKRRNNATPPQIQTRIVHAQSLGGSTPPLVITYTNEQDAIAEWLHRHVVQQKSVTAMGLDTETKPSFTSAAAKASQGPDVLQLAVATGHCLVIHLTHMPKYRSNAQLSGYAALSRLLQSTTVVKAGVALDQDALELFENHGLGTNGRLDLTCIQQMKQQTGQSKDNDEPVRGGLKHISQFHVPGMVLPKTKSLQMSNWARPLTDKQVGYAAADAFAGAIVVDRLLTENADWTRQILIAQVLQEETNIAQLRRVLEQRKRERKAAASQRNQERKQQSKGAASSVIRTNQTKQPPTHKSSNKRKRQGSDDNTNNKKPRNKTRKRQNRTKRTNAIEQSGQQSGSSLRGTLNTALSSSR